MATTPEADETRAVANHTLAYLRALDKKVDLIIDAGQRHQERLARIERDLGEMRRDFGRDLVEVKSDIALLENKVLTAQTEILVVLRRLAHDTELPTSEN